MKNDYRNIFRGVIFRGRIFSMADFMPVVMPAMHKCLGLRKKERMKRSILRTIHRKKERIDGVPFGIQCERLYRIL